MTKRTGYGLKLDKSPLPLSVYTYSPFCPNVFIFLFINTECKQSVVLEAAIIDIIANTTNANRKCKGTYKTKDMIAKFGMGHEFDFTNDIYLLHSVQKSPFPPSNHHATHLCGSGGHANLPGHKHLLNTMLDL